MVQFCSLMTAACSASTCGSVVFVCRVLELGRCLAGEGRPFVAFPTLCSIIAASSSASPVSSGLFTMRSDGGDKACCLEPLVVGIVCSMLLSGWLDGRRGLQGIVFVGVPGAFSISPAIFLGVTLPFDMSSSSFLSQSSFRGSVGAVFFSAVTSDPSLFGGMEAETAAVLQSAARYDEGLLPRLFVPSPCSTSFSVGSFTTHSVNWACNCDETAIWDSFVVSLKSFVV